MLQPPPAGREPPLYLQLDTNDEHTPALMINCKDSRWCLAARDRDRRRCACMNSTGRGMCSSSRSDSDLEGVIVTISMSLYEWSVYVCSSAADAHLRSQELRCACSFGTLRDLPVVASDGGPSSSQRSARRGRVYEAGVTVPRVGRRESGAVPKSAMSRRGEPC